MAIADQIRSYWDVDAATYDDAPNHRPTSPAERAAWDAALARLLPPPPARVLDCGAGTGFLSMIAARMGHLVTALDVSSEMLDRLRKRAAVAGVGIEIVQGPADQPPPGPFDAVMERHLLWTLPDPTAALRRWREVAPDGRLVLVEGVWGQVDALEVLRARGRKLVRTWRKRPDDHHGHYDPDVTSALPFGRGTAPSSVVDAALSAGWPDAWLERLRDVEWAATVDLPLPERLLGVPA
ncbi:MAG: class I SAM-dependent methyltransferase, partial [Acidimicrobiales bacterium]